MKVKSVAQVAIYSSGDQLEWREVNGGGQLPSPREGPRATLVNNVLYLTGGFTSLNDITSVLAWDPVAEIWQPAGDLEVGRSYHAAVAVSAADVALYCLK